VGDGVEGAGSGGAEPDDAGAAARRAWPLEVGAKLRNAPSICP